MLQRAAVVILNDVPVAQVAAERLGAFVGARRRPARRRRERGDMAGAALGRRADVLPALPGAAGRSDRRAPARLGALEYGHPIFELFRAPRSGDFSAARFYSYRAAVRRPRARRSWPASTTARRR